MYDDDDEVDTSRDEIEAFKSFHAEPDNPWEQTDDDDEELEDGPDENIAEEQVNGVNQSAESIQRDMEISNTPLVVNTKGESAYCNVTMESKHDPKIEADDSEEIKDSIPRLTDVSLARYVKKKLGNEIGYIPDKQMMMLYSTEDNRWLQDGNLHYTKQKIRLLLDDLPYLTNDKNEQAKIMNRVESSGFPPSIAAELKLIANKMGENNFDANPMLMGVKNGVIDLESGTFRAGKVEDHITRTAGTPYDPKGTCPRFQQFIYEIMCEDMEMVEYLQTFMGYICMGHNPDQIFMIMQGRGDNGKSLLLNVIERMMGGYATPMALATVVDNGRETVGDDLMSLVGFRAMVARELKKYQVLHAAKLKMLTGNDSFLARHLYGRYTSIQTTGVPIIGTNEFPKIMDSSNGLLRRMRLMPFTYEASKAKKDPSLLMKLMPELPGILNWCLEGLKRYQAGLFKEPKKMRDMMENLRQERSPLELFIFSHYEKSSQDKIGSSDLYRRYQEWKETTANAPELSHKQFSLDVERLGIEKLRPKGTVFCLKPKEIIGWNDDDIDE